MNAMELEIIASHSGRHLAECTTNEQRDSCLEMLRKVTTQFYLRDRYFSIEKFNDKVFEVEALHRERLKGIPQMAADIFSTKRRSNRGMAQIRKKATTTRRPNAKRK
jgi:hypothetical protein